VGLLGERRPKVLPPMEVVFVEPGRHPVYGFTEKQSDTLRIRFECPAQVTPAELRRIEKVVRDTWTALDCRDVARVDMRMTPEGKVYVIEINPLPGLTPDFSDLCTIARVSGMDYRTLIGEILAGCVKRHRETRSPRERVLATASGDGAKPRAPAANEPPATEVDPRDGSTPPPLAAQEAKGTNGTNGA